MACIFREALQQHMTVVHFTSKYRYFVKSKLPISLAPLVKPFGGRVNIPVGLDGVVKSLAPVPPHLYGQ